MRRGTERTAERQETVERLHYNTTYTVKQYEQTDLRENTQRKQESPADAGIPARRKNDEKNSSISKL